MVLLTTPVASHSENSLNHILSLTNQPFHINFQHLVSGLYITLHIDEARQLLAALEIYATDCYNVTAMHKVQVNALDTIEDVDAFDITADYPERLVFNMMNK